MKKILFVCALFIGASSLVSTLSIYATEAPCSIGVELPEDARPISVYKIVQVGGTAWSTSRVSAYYSPSNNYIYVNEGKRKNQPYTVTENRAYGQSNDARAKYRYVAGGYYFNL